MKKPLVFSEFGKSKKDSGYSEGARDAFLSSIYTSIYKFARNGGIGGGLVWQILGEGMESYDDGYDNRFISKPFNKQCTLSTVEKDVGARTRIEPPTRVRNDERD